MNFLVLLKLPVKDLLCSALDSDDGLGPSNVGSAPARFR